MSLTKYKAYSGVTAKLEAAVRNGKVAHAYIFEGDSASGKFEIARDFAKAILCEEMPGVGCDRCRSCRMIEAGTYRDLYYFGSDASSVKDRDIEELQGRMGNLPMESGGRNIAIVEDADLMTRRAQNRLLKLLEEPYEGSVIIMLSENSDSLLPTVRSRCQKFRFHDIDSEEAEIRDEYRELAARTVKDIKKGNYFFEIKNSLGEVMEKKTALSFLDSFERVMRNIMLGEEDIDFPKEKAKKSIGYIEEARKYLRYNVSPKNVIGDLLLKIGG